MDLKRQRREESGEITTTRTLLISGLNGKTHTENILENLKAYGQIKETYTIQSCPNICFVIFYDLRSSEKAFEDLKEKGMSVIYTVSKYEIPRDIDRCDELKNQGTVLVITRDLDKPLSSDDIKELFKDVGEIKQIREYKTFQKFVEFYDTRAAVNAVKKHNETACGKGILSIRFIWDVSVQQRWQMIAQTDEILKAQNIKNSSEEKDTKKTSQTKIYKKSLFLKVLDDFIVENLDLFE